MTRRRSFGWPYLLAACGLLATGHALAQARDPRAIAEDEIQSLNDRNVAVTRWEPTARTLAGTLLDGYVLVAAGRFDDLPIVADEEAARRPADITATFTVSRVFQGTASAPVRIRLNSDMLYFPLAETSRYAWRQEERGRQIAEEKSFDASFETLTEKLRSGAITRQQYDGEHARLTAAREQLVRASLRTSSRIVGVIDGETFYDRGGNLRAGETYLIGVNPPAGEPSLYVLEELPRNGTNIFWERTMGGVIDELEDAVR